MIYYFIWAIAMILLFYFGHKLFKKPKTENNYIPTPPRPAVNEKPAPPKRSELDVLLGVIADNQDDKMVLSALTEVYEQLITPSNELDVLILTLSELLYDRASTMDNKEEAHNVYRAARITKRLAHNLYRRYRVLNPAYTNPKFLQFVD